MPSPDVSQYLDLTLLDVDAQQLAARAFLDAASKLPEWTPREGLIEAVLIEAMALEVAESVYAVNRLPAGVTEVLLRLFGVERDQGAPPSADVRIIVADAAGYTIPANTTVRLELGNGIDPVDLTTATELTIAPGSTSGVVRATGSTSTLEANGIPAGTTLAMLDAIPYVNGAELASAAAGGRLPEDSAAYLARASVRLSRLTTTLVRPSDFEAYVAELAGITRVRVLDLYDPARPAGAPGSRPGYVTTAVAGQGGSSLSNTELAAIAGQLRDRSHAGLTVSVVNADVTTVDVELTVLRLANATDSEVLGNVRAAIADYLNPDTWDWSGTVRVNELIAVADRAAGVDTILEVVTPAGDVELAGVAPLARAGLVTITVQAPA